MFIRAILYLIASVLFISVLRAVIGALGRMFSETFASPQPAGPKKPAVPVSEALKRDPVCGTYIAASSALTKTAGGTTYYFCSAECRDKFAARSAG